MKINFEAKRLDINGVVQGVGFRPFLFVLAKRYNLAGEVSNTSSGVSVLIEGRKDDIKGYIADIIPKRPILSSVTQIETRDETLKGLTSFKIVKSQDSKTRATLISPDVTVCDDCLSEMNDPLDRRYHYPFINCTNCGPRYTIIDDIPYDRPKTSMKHFKMCAACHKEYDDPLDRRFHAQPNACPECGPEVFLIDADGRKIEAGPDEVIRLAGEYLKSGKILGIKGLGGFHLACDATNAQAVKKLRDKKNRPHKPFALMAGSSSALFSHVEISDEELALLNAYQRPIVLLKKEQKNTGILPVSKAVAPLNNYLGIMLPYTPVHELLLQYGPEILVMTSGNRSGEPLSIANDDALDAFSHIADFFLLHNRDIYFRADDSIARIQAGETRFIRRSRGYAPLPVFYEKKLPQILACGAGLKNTVCLTRDNYLFLSQHIGDLSNLKIYDFFCQSIDHLKKILDIEPEIIVHDLHPGLMSTGYAKEQGSSIEKIAVQHHHAHAVACMAENELDEPVIAITLDGTGLGTDGHIWGGEILIAGLDSFERKTQLDYIDMPGGDAAVLEPWRMAASILFKAFGRDAAGLDIPFIKQMDKTKFDFIMQMIEKGVNSPKTSSCGRVFDAVSALLNIRHVISHEGQAAMELEAVADQTAPYSPYAYDLSEPSGEKGWIISLLPGISQMVDDIQNRKSNSIISARFHSTIIDCFSKSASRISASNGIKKVVLSGGVFNNDIIFNGMIQALEQKSLDVYTHSKVPAGDGGISFGQAVAAAAMKGVI